VQVLSVNLYDDLALLDALLRVSYFLVLREGSLVIFAQENQAFSVTAGCDEHHMYDIVVVELLMVHNFLKAFARGRLLLPLILFQLDKVID